MPYEIMIGHPLILVAKGSLTVSSVAIGIPAAQLDLAKGGDMEVLLGVETDQVRLSPDTVAATTTDMLFDVGDKLRLAGPTLCRNMTMIRVTGDSVIRYWIFGKAI